MLPAICLDVIKVYRSDADDAPDLGVLEQTLIDKIVDGIAGDLQLGGGLLNGEVFGLGA